MNEEIFRKKNLDKAKSPENLDDYIRVSNPGVWLLLVSVILLLAGACVWGIFGKIESTLPTTVIVEGGEAVCYLTQENLSSVTVDKTVRFGGTEATIVSIDAAAGDTPGYCCVLRPNDTLADGFYEGTIVTKSVRPLSFVLN